MRDKQFLLRNWDVDSAWLACFPTKICEFEFWKMSKFEKQIKYFGEIFVFWLLIFGWFWHLSFFIILISSFAKPQRLEPNCAKESSPIFLAHYANVQSFLQKLKSWCQNHLTRKKVAPIFFVWSLLRRQNDPWQKLFHQGSKYSTNGFDLFYLSAQCDQIFRDQLH